MNYHRRKKQKIIQGDTWLLAQKHCKILKFAQFLGLLTSACPAVKYGWLYTKLFERTKFLALRSNSGNYNSKMLIPQEVKNEHKWWLGNTSYSSNSLKNDTFCLEIYTDSSLSGWGAFCQGRRTHGWWTTSEGYILWTQMFCW